MNQKARHLDKGKTDSSVKKRLRKLHTSEYENSCLKKILFIPMKMQLITISSAIPYISGMNSTNSFLKKEKISRKRKGKGKRRRESANGKKKGKGKRRRESENWREKEKEKEKKEEKEKEEKRKEEKMERAVLKFFFEYTTPSGCIP